MYRWRFYTFLLRDFPYFFAIGTVLWNHHLQAHQYSGETFAFPVLYLPLQITFSQTDIRNRRQRRGCLSFGFETQGIIAGITQKGS